VLEPAPRKTEGAHRVLSGREYTVDLIPKIKLELVIADTMVEKVVQAISLAARTANRDGRSFSRA